MPFYLSTQQFCFYVFLPREVKTYSHKKTCTVISTAASFVITTTTRKKTHKTPKYPLTGEKLSNYGASIL